MRVHTLKEGAMRSFLIASRAALFIRKGVVATATAGTLVIMTALVITFTGQAMAQKPSTDASMVDALFKYCLREKFPEIRRDTYTAYDPPSGRNFAWDSEKKAWIDIKTLESICPKTSAERADTFFKCLREKFPEIRRDTYTAYDPPSGRNFAWDSDKQAWIDTKTLECVCPKCKKAVPPSGPSAENLPFALLSCFPVSYSHYRCNRLPLFHR